MAIETSNECMTVEQVEELLRDGLSCQIKSDEPGRFKIGDRVRARVIHVQTYTRLPRYVRGKVGTIAKDHGVYVFPDAVGMRLDTSPQHVYSVHFAAQELWGVDASARDALYIDLFDDYLEPV
jgi:Nitrile hydratase beta subunit